MPTDQSPSSVLRQAPEPFTTTRYRCPWCGRTYARKAGCSAHIARCWHNPAARACVTCAHLVRDYDEPEVGYKGAGEYCDKDLPLGKTLDGRDTFAIHCAGWEARNV